GARVALIVGGVHASEQIEKLRTGCQVVVGTPGRVLEFLAERILSLAWCETVVLDEADRMLDMGFIDDVTKILDRTPPERQTLLFSATLPTEIKRLLHRYMRDPLVCSTNDGVSTAPEIDQRYVEVEFPRKFRVLAKLLDESPDETAIIFTNTKRQAIDLDRMLWGHGYSAGALHGDQDQETRFRILEGFRRGEIRALVATDVASRGLDIEKVGKVINYEIPREVDSYVHRIGRTGRAKARGIAISLVSSRERRSWQEIVRRSKSPIERMSTSTRRERGERGEREERGERGERSGRARAERGARAERPATVERRSEERGRSRRAEPATSRREPEPVDERRRARSEDDTPAPSRDARARGSREDRSPSSEEGERSRRSGRRGGRGRRGRHQPVIEDLPAEPWENERPARGAGRVERVESAESDEGFELDAFDRTEREESDRGQGSRRARGRRTRSARGDAPDESRDVSTEARRNGAGRRRQQPRKPVEFTPEERELLKRKPRERPEKRKLDELDEDYFGIDYFEVEESENDRRSNRDDDRRDEPRSRRRQGDGREGRGEPRSRESREGNRERSVA
ncbi:MAG TPA: DEAD/DEAH box helicase, partial [Planctomycetota bacterium]|nr:DEAD/DEAH box helicase [Planctomycetota bacterium]